MNYSHVAAAIRQVTLGIVFASLALGLGGCVFGVTKVEVTHSPLSEEITKREGTILVKQFSDGRQPGRRVHIGNKRNGFGMVLGNIGTQDGVNLEALLTSYFVDALRHAGYNTVLQPGSGSSDVVFDAVLEGEIKEFWLDLYMMTWHNINVRIMLKDKAETQVLWDRDIRGQKTNVLWIGVSAEFERVIRQALDVALDQAVKEFASTGFQDAIKSGAVPAGVAASTEPPLAH